LNFSEALDIVENYKLMRFKNFLKGFFSLFNVAGTFPLPASVLTILQKSDADALREDWEAVGFGHLMARSKDNS
jgi:hypothetical protein